MDIQLRFVMKDMFFDRQKIIDKVGKANKKAISHAAALIRKSAKQSMRTVKNLEKSSQPGKPPYAHNKRIKNAILYGYDANREQAVIGPSASYGVNDVPALHEFGGRQRIGKISPYAVYVGKPINAGSRGRTKKRVKTVAQARRIVEFLNSSRASRHSRKFFVVDPPPSPSKYAKYPARPFMRPALTKMIPTIRNLYPRTFGDAWKASV